MSILNDDVNQLERFLDTGAKEIIQTVVNVVLVGIVFLFISPVLMVLAFAPIPVILWGSFRYQRRLEPRYREVRAEVGDLLGSLANNLGGIATIKAFTAEEREVARIGGESDAYRLANRDAIQLLVRVRPADPHRHPGRVHLHAAGRRARRAERHPSRSGCTRSWCS